MKDYRQVKEEIRLYDDSLLERPEVVVVNKVDLPEVKEQLTTIREILEESKIQGFFVSAIIGEGMDEVLDVVADMVETQRGMERVPTREIPILYPEPRGERPSVERRGEVFVLKSSRAERLVRRVDLDDERVQLQLWHEFQRMGVAQALKRAGAKSGAVVRIGESELEWK
jgi:GTP-binding protein